MKFKKNEKINTIEYFASCICPQSTCSAICGCRCVCNDEGIRQLNNRYDRMDADSYYYELNKYDGVYAEELATW